MSTAGFRSISSSGQEAIGTRRIALPMMKAEWRFQGHPAKDTVCALSASWQSSAEAVVT
jgi:hypothetical protein